ncbi:hypothetical protein FPOA_00148 [Fusarium poae]|uniref:Transmembrane protein n=1 Tax=Fusarium poae TaxID=36050 RepID=A0A1B8B0E4_FUSPO|nr:hypothetical protein FPOA_00148 [Fusarium poae]
MKSAPGRIPRPRPPRFHRNKVFVVFEELLHHLYLGAQKANLGSELFILRLVVLVMVCICGLIRVLFSHGGD